MGGDIIENKKTWMYLKALSIADVDDKNRLALLYNTKMNDAQKIEQVVELFEKYEIPALIKAEIENYTKKAFENCNELDISNTRKKVLIDFGTMLMNRKI